MPRAYSLDLRERVVRFFNGVRSRHAAARHFGVSVSFVVNLMQAWRTRGSLAPKPVRGRRHARLETHRAFLLTRVAEKHDITVPMGRRRVDRNQSRLRGIPPSGDRPEWQRAGRVHPL